MTMNSAISVAVLHDGIDESPGGLIQIPSLDNELRDGVIMLLEEEFGEGRCSFLSLWVLDSEVVERLGKRLRSPYFNARASDALQLLQDLPLPFKEAVPSTLHTIDVNANPAHSHVHETWQQIQFEISDAPQVLLAQLNGKVIPKFEGKFRVCFGVWTDIHSGHLPHFSFGIDTEFPSSLS